MDYGHPLLCLVDADIQGPVELERNHLRPFHVNGHVRRSRLEAWFRWDVRFKASEEGEVWRYLRRR